MTTLRFDELVSIGYERLVEADREFDPAHGVPFRTYASWEVLRAMQDAARAERSARRRASSEPAALAVQSGFDHACADGTAERDAELAGELGALMIALGRLDPIDAALLVGVYLEERPLGEVVAELGMHRATAWERRERALARLRKMLAGDTRAADAIGTWPRERKAPLVENVVAAPRARVRRAG